MLKRLFIILILLIPTVTPVSGAVCGMMMNYFSAAGNAETMDCCLTDGSGNCPMAMAESLTSSHSVSATPTDKFAVGTCNCAINGSSVPGTLLLRRLKPAVINVTPLALPTTTFRLSALNYRPATCQANISRLISFQHPPTCLRIYSAASPPIYCGKQPGVVSLRREPGHKVGQIIVL